MISFTHAPYSNYPADNAPSAFKLENLTKKDSISGKKETNINCKVELAGALLFSQCCRPFRRWIS